MSQNRSQPVATGFLLNRLQPVAVAGLNRDQPVAGGSVRSPQKNSAVATGCGCGCGKKGSENRTGPDLQTLGKINETVLANL